MRPQGTFLPGGDAGFAPPRRSMCASGSWVSNWPIQCSDSSASGQTSPLADRVRPSGKARASAGGSKCGRTGRLPGSSALTFSRAKQTLPRSQSPPVAPPHPDCSGVRDPRPRAASARTAFVMRLCVRGQEGSRASALRARSQRDPAARSKARTGRPHLGPSRGGSPLNPAPVSTTISLYSARFSLGTLIFFILCATTCPVGPIGRS